MLKLKQNGIFILIGCAIVLFFSVSLIGNFDNNEVSQVSQISFPSDVQEEKSLIPFDPKVIFVDIKGAIKKPGVYKMNEGDRVIDAIEKASGFLEDANKDLINLALLVEDEMVIYVPVIGEEETIIESYSTITSSKSQQNNKININQATAEELQQIPGIGPSKASAIISYRDENGKFTTIEELKNVSGIGAKTLDKMRDFITVK